METRRHNKLSDRPYLSIRVMISKQAPYMGIQIENNGIGPAIIKKCILFIDKTVSYLGTCYLFIKLSERLNS